MSTVPVAHRVWMVMRNTLPAALPETPDLDLPISTYNSDSLDAVELAIALEEELHISFGNEDAITPESTTRQIIAKCEELRRPQTEAEEKFRETMAANTTGTLTIRKPAPFEVGK